MKNLHNLNYLRDVSMEVKKYYGNTGDDKAGVFIVPSETDQATLRVIASSEYPWDHVSVSCKNRCPNWPEMEQVKRLFFKADEVAFQLHVPASDHINVHPYCLHIWRPHYIEIPLPPSIMVGPVSAAAEGGGFSQQSSRISP